jgi:bifunctional non-homologous end joining protein LigD
MPREPHAAPTGDPLAVYRAKRDFSRSPEPSPGPRASVAAPSGEARPLEFVVQKHDATRQHYDVRIEIAGAMMSWAVPKGPSYDPTVKRLAIETEDHPMEYNRF